MLYVLENDYLKVYVSDMGATLVKLIDKKSNTDCVLGFKSDDDYKNSATYVGASVGRNANRIGNAKFELNGQTYNLTVNDNMNQLHGGGINGFSFKTWEKKAETKEEITFAIFSKDGEEGFPGNLNVEVTYKLDRNSLIWSYSGICDQDTILNMTNHSYFNLGDKDIYNHELKIHTDKYSPVDEYSLTKDEVVFVKNTPYDFIEFTKVKDNLDKLGGGIDNNYVWEQMGDKLMAELKYNNLKLNVYSDLPDMHFYTGEYLHGDNTKNDGSYKPFDGLCLECQYYPNGINYSNYIKPILKKNEKMTHYIRYEIEDITRGIYGI